MDGSRPNDCTLGLLETLYSPVPDGPGLKFVSETVDRPKLDGSTPTLDGLVLDGMTLNGPVLDEVTPDSPTLDSVFGGRVGTGIEVSSIR